MVDASEPRACDQQKIPRAAFDIVEKEQIGRKGNKQPSHTFKQHLVILFLKSARCLSDSGDVNHTSGQTGGKNGEMQERGTPAGR